MRVYNICAANTENLATTRFSTPTATTASTKATSSRSPNSTGPPGQPRVEHGSRGEITAITPRGITIALDGSDRHINLHQEQLDTIRLGYAQHVYRQQGATVQRSVVLTGGWQTSKESAYVEATRARHGTDWYLARDQLGEEGQDPHRIRRLAEHMRSSHAQTPSLTIRERADTGWEPSRDPLRHRAVLSPTRLLDRALRRTTINLTIER